MSTNPFFKQGNGNEQDLYESLLVESIQMYGKDVYYLPRTVISETNVLGEDSQSSFDSYHSIEMYVESYDTFGGEGDLFQKFGIEIRDSMNLVVSRARWQEQIGNQIGKPMPDVGDLIYYPEAGAYLEIAFTEDEKPFYQLDHLMEFKIQCNLFEYRGEAFNTGFREIDKIEYELGSGGMKMRLVATNSPQDYLETLKEFGETVTDVINLGDILVQGNTSCKLYSIEPEGESSTIFNIIVGQIKGTFTESETEFLTSDNPLVSFEIDTIYDIDNSTDNSQQFPTDVQTDNVIIEQEADDIVDFDENNPFGNM